MDKKNNEKLKTIVKIFISLSLILYILLKKVNREELVDNFRLLNWEFIPIIFSLIIAHYIVSSLRWKSLLVHEKARGTPIKYLISLYFTGAFFNNFMPTSVGGDVYKMYKLAKRVDDPGIGFSSVFSERFTGIIMLALIAVLSMSKTLKFGVLILVFWFILGVYIGIYMLKFIGKKIRFFGKLYDALIVYKDYPKVLGLALLTSIVVQILAIFVQYFTFIAIGVRLPLLYSFLAFPVITLIGFFIPSLNGLGVQDALYVSMFSMVGVPAATALSASIIYHLSRLGVSLIGGVLYALGKDA